MSDLTNLPERIRAEAAQAARPGQMERLETIAADVERLQRGARTLGHVIEQQGRMALDVTGMHQAIAEEGEGLAEVLMRAVFIPGPVHVDENGAIVLTSSEARRAADRMTDWLAAHVAKAKESAWDEGWEASQDYGRGGTPVPPNPYRADRIEGTR